MGNVFLDKEMASLIEKVDKVDQKPLSAYIKMIGSPKNVREFLQTFDKSIKEGRSSQTICFKLIEKINDQEFFSCVFDIVGKTENSVQAQTLFKVITAIPDDIKIVENYMEMITNLIKNINDTEVLYHGVCLIYRIVTKHPELAQKLEEEPIVLSKKSLDGIINKFDILDKWQTKNHRGKTKPGYFATQDDFINFSMNFIKFQ